MCISCTFSAAVLTAGVGATDRQTAFPLQKQKEQADAARLIDAQHISRELLLCAQGGSKCMCSPRRRPRPLESNTSVAHIFHPGPLFYGGNGNLGLNVRSNFNSVSRALKCEDGSVCVKLQEEIEKMVKRVG